MRTRGTKKSATTDFLASPPLQPEATPNRSTSESPPMKFAFNFNSFTNNTTSCLKKKKKSIDSKKKSTAAVAATLVPMQHNGSSSPLKNPSSISDLKDLASARLDFVKQQLDRSHSDTIKEVEAFHSHHHKRLKIQTQACQQVMDEAEKEYKKIVERINESQEAMNASYMEFIAEAQASASHVCKTFIPELAQSLEKSIDSLRSRHGNASTLV